MKKSISDRFAQLVIAIWSLRTATKIRKGKMTINDVPEKFRECVNEAIKIQERNKKE